MAKILAGDYFTNSVLFTADIINGRPTNSATSSGVRYSLKCKKCNATNERTGNSKQLNTCKSCGRTWDRETNTIIEKEEPVIVEEPEVPVIVPAKSTRGRRKVPEPVVEDPVDDELAVVATPKVTTQSIIDLLVRSSEGELERAPTVKTKSLKKKATDVYEIEEIIDYYDQRLEDRWHRIYYVQWVGYDKPTFVHDVDFTDPKFLKDFENSLPEEERFSVMFPRPKNKTTKHVYRTLKDVYEDQDISDDEDAIEELPVTTTTTSTRHVVIPAMKRGQSFFHAELGVTLVYQ